MRTTSRPRAPRSPNHKLLNRGTGLVLLGAGLAILALLYVAPVPEFQALEARPGTLVEARRERFSPCRRTRSDCTRTMVTVDHPGEVRDYHFADVDTALFRAGAPITVWTYPELRGLDRVRVWHAEQEGRVLRDHAAEARTERRVRLWSALLVPAIVLGGGWIAWNYTWGGRRAA